MAATTLKRASPESIPTRESLLGRLKDWDDDESWRDFYDTYWRLIYGVAMKSGLSEAEAADVLQETVIAITRRMREFKYDPALGSFKGWLLHQTRWQIANQFRRRQRGAVQRVDETGKTRLMETVPDPATAQTADRVWDDEWERNILMVALERIKEKVPPRQMQIYQLYVQKEWPVSKVARTLDVSATLVYVTKHRITTLIKQEVRRLMKQHL